jgi:hypothetical protein
MKFSFVPRVSHRVLREEAPTFTIARLWKGRPAKATPDEDAPVTSTEISSAFDRSYHYQSEQELRWHLAERFGVPVETVALSRA